jgi:hypothetical protein
MMVSIVTRTPVATSAVSITADSVQHALQLVVHGYGWLTRGTKVEAWDQQNAKDFALVDII